MIMKVFSVYDSKGLAYGVPFFMVTVGSAVRAFSDLANDTQTMASRHPSDYVLYEIGSFDDNSGVFTSIVPHIHLGIAADFVSVKPVVYRPAAPVAAAVANPLATVEELSNGREDVCNR